MEFTFDHLRASVVAVPPLARDASLKICVNENAKIIRFLEAGGIRSLLYGGNAIFYHVRQSEYANILSMLAELASSETMVVPSIGPAYGVAVDQVEVLRDYDFPTAMLLPSRDVVDQQGVATAVRRLAEQLGKPLVLYLKFDRWLEPALIKSLQQDGAVSWIKYAVVRDDPRKDDFLREVLDAFPAERVVSGIGEQPAIIHLRDFGVAGFTSGCVCVAPERSMEMMRAIQSGDIAHAESIQSWFRSLEELRNEINPIRVLHRAVEVAGIAQTGPMIPMLSELSESQRQQIANAIEVMHATVDQPLDHI